MTLALAVLVIVAVVFLVRSLLGMFDGSRALATPAIPDRIDPLEVAFLRSGRGDVLRTALIDLQARGLIEIGESEIVRMSASVAPLDLPPLEGAILAELDEPKKFPALARAALPALNAYLDPLRARLAAQSLVPSPGPRAAALALKTAGAALLVLAAVAFCATATSVSREQGGAKPALFVVLFVVGFIAYLSLVKVGRVTDRGRRYLERLTTGFPQSALRANAGWSAVASPAVAPPAVAPTPFAASPAFAMAGAAVAVPLLVGLYGVGALSDTPYSAASTHMRPRRPDGSGGCSLPYSGSGSCGCCGSGHGGCGSGSCSGGCGGGGCGGGGCGG